MLDSIPDFDETCFIIPLMTPLIDPNWINSELKIALVKILNNFLY